MATTQIVLIKKPNKDGLLPVRLRVTVNRAVSYQTLFYIPEKHFNPTSGRITIYHPLHRQYNELISTRLAEVAEIIHVWETDGRAFTAGEVLSLDYADWQRLRAAQLEKVSVYSPTSFVLAAEEIVKRKWADGDYATYRRYNTYVRKLKEYVKTLGPGRSDVELMEMNDDFLREWFLWSREKAPVLNGPNTLHKRWSFVKQVLREAHEGGVIPRLPYKHFKSKWQKVKKTKLTKSELKDIQDLPLVRGSSEYRCRSVFMLQFYLLGTRISDVLSLRNADVVTRRDGMDIVFERVTFKQRKTGVLMDIRLSSQAQAIIADYYHPHKTGEYDYLLPYMNWRPDPLVSGSENEQAYVKQIIQKTALVNKYLAVITARAGIKKRVSSHIARHSFAQQALKNKTGIYAISQALGHSSIKQTEVYLEDLNTDEMDKAFEGFYD